MQVKYVGQKKRVPIYLPIGSKTRSTIKQIVWAEPYADLSEQDAQALLAIAPLQFELVSEPGLEIHEAEKPPVKKAGRPRKEAVA